MNRKLLVGLVVVLVVGAVVVWALLPRSPSVRPGTGDIRLGTVLGLTGDNASYGKKMQRGFDFALDEINSSGGVGGRQLRLVVEDSKFDPTEAVNAYRKLTGQGIRIVVGITGSKNALPVCAASKEDDVVIVDALGSAPKLTTDGGPNYFRIMASDAFAGQYNVDWAMETGMKRPAVVYMEDDWGASYRDSIASYLSKKGFRNVPTLGVTEGTRDFRTQVEQLKARKPDAVFLLLYAKEASGFMQQLRQAGVGVAVYGSDNISSPEFVAAGPVVVEGVRVAMPAEASGPAYDEFTGRYRAKFNEDPDANVIKSYDAMKLVAAALARVGDEPARIKEYLRSPDFSFEGVSGAIKFDAHGDLVSQRYSRMVYKSGKLVALPRT